MTWATNPYGVPGIRTRGGVGNQQSQNSSSTMPVRARGGPVLPVPIEPPILNPTPPSLRTSIAPGAGSNSGVPINTTIPRQPRRGTIAWTYIHQVTAAQGNLPVQMPSFRLPAGSSARVRASNPGGGNANPIFAALDYFLVKLGAGGCTVLQSLDDVEFNVTNVAEIWVRGAVGDGVIISVNRPLQ